VPISIVGRLFQFRAGELCDHGVGTDPGPRINPNLVNPACDLGREDFNPLGDERAGASDFEEHRAMDYGADDHRLALDSGTRGAEPPQGKGENWNSQCSATGKVVVDAPSLFLPWAVHVKPFL
jgi:hypothetical protein